MMMMMQRGTDFIDEVTKKRPILGKDGNSLEIDMIEEAGILVTIKGSAQGIVRKPNPNLSLSSESGVGPNTQTKRWGNTPSRIIRLTHAVTDDDIECDYRSAVDDMTMAALKRGNSVNVVIPRPNPDHHLTPGPGVGKVFVEYADLDSASRFRSWMNGRYYAENHVVAEYYPENMYAQGHLDLDLDA